jgi:hypothetical protein
MFTYPVALWIELVLKDASLRKRYGEKAIQYLRFLERNVAQKWEYCWEPLPDGTGVYRSTSSTSEMRPGEVVPINRMNSLGRTLIVLSDLPECRQRALCRDHAVRLLQRFRQELQIKEGAYVWKYFSCLTATRIRDPYEDPSHARINIGFAMEGCRRQMVFGVEDMQ